MRKIVLALAAFAAFGLVVPAAAPARAQDAKVVIKTGDRDHGPRFHQERRKVTIIKRDHDHGARKTVIIKKKGHDSRAMSTKKVIIKRD